MKREKPFQLFETDTELVRSVFSNDPFYSTNGENTMSKKFDFNSLVAAEKQQSLDDHAEYQIVLREIASDTCDRPQAEILRLLERCERDTSDLQSDVEWRVKRDEQIAEIKRENEYRTKNTELLAKLKVMREDFEKVQAEYNAKRNPIIGESNSLDEKLYNIDRYRDDLFDSCRDANMKIELEVLKSSFSDQDRMENGLFARQRAISSEISQLEYERDHLPITVDREAQKKDLKQKIKRLQDEWQQLEARKDEIAQRKAEHQQAIGVLREKMIFS